MLGDILQRKLDFLRSSKHEGPSRALSLSFQHAVQPLRQEHALAPAVFRQLEIDIIYTLLKNAPWQQAPIFKDTVIDFLKSEYRLATAAANSIVTPLLGCLAAQALQGQSQNQQINYSDKDFLRYVFVATAAADDEDALLADLGLGRGILNWIRQGVTNACRSNQIRLHDRLSSSTNGNRSVAEIVFVPEIDALFAELMLEISSAAKNKPWITDIYRLQYDLLDIGEPWRGMLLEEGADWLFDLLLTIGRRGILLQPDIDAALAAVLPQYALSSQAGKQLMASLNQAALIMGLGGGQMPDPTIPRWRLLPKAEQLTATAFAHSYCQESPYPSSTQLASLVPCYQIAVLKSLSPDAQSALLEDIVLAQPKPLSPLALGVVLRQLPHFFTTERVEALFLQSLSRHRTPWHRTVILENMPESTSFTVAQTLAQVAQSDPSPSVRDAAAAVITRWQMLKPEVGLIDFESRNA